jgi:hypothetical protein
MLSHGWVRRSGDAFEREFLLKESPIFSGDSVQPLCLWKVFNKGKGMFAEKHSGMFQISAPQRVHKRLMNFSQ